MRRLPSLVPGLLVLPALLALAGPAPAHAGAGVTVAVLYFDYNGSDENMAYLRKGLAEMLVSDLVDTPGVEVVERMKLEEVLKELDLSRDKRISRDSALRVGKLLGARYLVAGSYTLYKDSLIVSLRVLEVETGKIVIGRQNHKGTVDDFFAMEQSIAAGLRTALEERLSPASARSSGASSKPDGSMKSSPSSSGESKSKSKSKSKSNDDKAQSDRIARAKARKPKKLSGKVAARYGKALDAADRGDKKAARTELEAIVKEQPDFQLAEIDLASLAKGFEN